MSASIADTGSGTPVQPPQAAPSTLDHTKAVFAEMGIADLSGAGGPEAAPKAPAPEAQPPKPAEPQKAEPPAKEAKAEPPATPPAAKEPYTLDELDAFDGNYDRRDFDWDRVPENLRAYAKRLASGTGKYRQRLEAQIRAEHEAGTGKSQPPQASGTTTPPGAALTPEALNANLNTFLDPENPVADRLKGLESILGAPEGRAILSRLGFSDPTERAVVSDLVQEQIVRTAIVNIAEDFPQYVDDPDYRKEVTSLIEATPVLKSKVEGRDVNEATFAFAVGNAYVLAQRLNADRQAIAEARTKLDADLAALKTQQDDLKRQIEATTRKEPASPSLSGQAAGATTGSKTLVDEARDIIASVGPIG